MSYLDQPMDLELDPFLAEIHALSHRIRSALEARITDWEGDSRPKRLEAAVDAVFSEPDGSLSGAELGGLLTLIKNKMMGGQRRHQAIIFLKFLEKTVDVADAGPEFAAHILSPDSPTSVCTVRSPGGLSNAVQGRLIAMQDVLNHTLPWTEEALLVHLCALSRRIRAGLLASDCLDYGMFLPLLLIGDLEKVVTDESKPFSREDIGIVLGYMERGMCKGDQALQSAIATGFIEAVISSAYRESNRVRPLLQQLGPECRAYADAWAGFDTAADPSVWPRHA